MQQHRRPSHTRKSAAVKPNAILPADKTQAISMMIRITNGLVSISEKESQALAQNDLLSFAVIQDEKASLADRYAMASEEFRANVSKYRGVEKSLLERLSKAQDDLGERMKQINFAVEGIYTRAQAKAQSCLISAQEFGQARVRYEEPAEDAALAGGAAC